MSRSEGQWVDAKDSGWQNEWKRMGASKAEWILVLKENKRPVWFLNNFIQIFMQYITTNI